MADPQQIAQEVARAYAARAFITPFSARDGGLDLATAYAAEAVLVEGRRADGHRTAGLKVGYANKAVWRMMKLETLVWAHLYDDTVWVAPDGRATLPVSRMTSPKIEPEIVFRMKSTLPAGLSDAAGVLAHVESIGLGFEIIDCIYSDWKFQPADFVAAYGLHAALMVGPPLPVTDANLATLAEALPSFTVTLQKNGVTVAEGSGKNSLRSPALCLAELATALAGRGAPPLGPGDLVSSGTLTDGQPIAIGEQWTGSVSGLDVRPLSIHTVA
jgi:2-oxo-3-hexenedioate decarboxylase